MHPPASVHQAGEAGLEAPGQVDDDQLVPGGGGHAGARPPRLRGQLSHHLPEEDCAVGPLLSEVSGGHHLPPLGREVGQH